MFLTLFLSVISFAICRARATVPFCSSSYGTSINSSDCKEALSQPIWSTLWTRIGYRHAIIPDQHSVHDLGWHPLIYLASASARTSNGSVTSGDSGLFSDCEIARDSGIITPYLLSRVAAPDDLLHTFVLPIIGVYQSCAIGIDLNNRGLPASWRTSERPLDAFRAVESVLNVCTDAEETRGQGGSAETMSGELQVFVTDPELLQNSTPYTGQSLKEIIAYRAYQREWLE